MLTVGKRNFLNIKKKKLKRKGKNILRDGRIKQRADIDEYKNIKKWRKLMKQKASTLKNIKQTTRNH